MEVAEFLSRCTFSRLTPELQASCRPFKCGDEDLDDFFGADYLLYGKKLLGKTYVFREKERPENIVAAFTISNDSIRIKQLAPEDKARIEYVAENGEKNLRRYPGVLVGRLGTNESFANKGYGTAMMDFIKAWFRSDENKTGCRFIIVDAINKPGVVHYYQKNKSRFLYGTEANEAKAMGLNPKRLGNDPLHTRLMYFDLISIE